MDEDPDIARRRRDFWPDPYIAAIAEAEPGSGLFTEFLALAQRSRLDVPDNLFGGAAIGAVMYEREMGYQDLAAGLGISPMIGYAIMTGWHRLGLRGLAQVADILDVPISSFIRTKEWRKRLEVTRYDAYRKAVTQEDEEIL